VASIRVNSLAHECIRAVVRLFRVQQVSTTIAMDTNESPALPPPRPLADDSNGSNNGATALQSAALNEDTVSSTPPTTPPSAPTKIRRRRPLLSRLRSRRRQLLQQHAAANNDDKLTGRGRRKSLVENYYRVDTLVQHSPLLSPSATASTKPAAAMGHHGKRVKVILPGVPRYEEDWARDSHDFFNLIVLIPVTVLNVMNWNWDMLFAKLSAAKNLPSAMLALKAAWTGDWFDLFFGITAGYFVIDVLWILIVPVCVKSPAVILQHHVAVLVFILIPYHHAAVRYCMGACMSVEVNTWFLIARRVFNKQGFPPWTIFNSSWLSIRVKVISIFFYLTWISIRCVLYPALLVPFYQHWRDLSLKTGTWWNILLPAVPLHAAFCLLNLKWTYELIMSKLRYFRRQILYYQHQRRHGIGANGQHRQNLGSPDPNVSSGL
jgi:TLC domain